nr:hypothetical protein [Chitinophagaceae bacterium]
MITTPPYLKKGDTVAAVRADNNGDFKIEVEPETLYEVIAYYEGYTRDDLEVIVPKASCDGRDPGLHEITNKVRATLTLQKEIEGEEWEVNNIYYDY